MHASKIQTDAATGILWNLILLSPSTEVLMYIHYVHTFMNHVIANHNPSLRVNQPASGQLGFVYNIAMYVIVIKAPRALCTFIN